VLDHSQRIADLSPEKRALFMRRLAAQAAGRVKPPLILPRPTAGDTPAALAQRRLWFLDQLEPGSALYLIPAALEMIGTLNAAALQRTLNEIVRRHEALRTTFYTLDDQPMQRVTPELLLELPVIDLRDHAESDRWREMLRLATEEAQRPFDLSRGPLVRAALLRLADDHHVLLLTLHHLIADGWSCGVLIKELAALYAAYVNDRPSPLPDLPLHYADFAHWQRQWLQGEVLEKQLAYWKQQLTGASAVLELPADHSRPARPMHCGAHLSFALNAALSDQLRALARRAEATLFMVLLSAFHALLHRYTGQTDICVGTVIANRDRAETENLIGFFVNTLPLRVDLAGEPSFHELLQRVRETALSAYAHQDVPFDLIVEALSVDRNAGTSPLFQVEFDLENTAFQPLELPGLEVNLLSIERGTSKFDLALSMEDSPAGLRGTLEYATDLFEPATMSRFIVHFQTLLSGIAADPDCSIAVLPLLSTAEQQQLNEWNATAVDYPLERNVPQLVEARAEQAPNALAVATATQALTYDELNRRANQLAHKLQALGSGPQQIVGLCVDRSLDLIVGALGVLKAGGAYLPIDPAYPPERIAFMLQDSQASVVLTQHHLLAAFQQPNSEFQIPNLICLDTDWPLLAAESDANPICSAPLDTLAYVIYTSGSTGQPKGVMIEQRSLLNLVFWHRRVLEVTSSDRATQLAGQGFDAAVWEVWPYLTAGASLHIPDDETRTSPQHLRDWLLSKAITITFLPTPLAESVLLLSWPRATALRYLLTGGDKLHVYPPPDLPFQLINNYGPTEGTVVTTSGRVPANASRAAAPSIGRPIDNTRLYILNQHLQLVPIGVPGELHIGGAGLARGYLNRPDLTAEKFVTDPFAAPASGGGQAGTSNRLYKTGDLVRYLPNGEIEFLGRIDQQVKVRGCRIELGEIEAALTRHPAIKTAAVISHTDDVGSPRLAAYLVPQQLPAPSSIELRAFLKRTLPDYMVPAAFVVLDALPLTPNGKVDRRALPAPEWLPTRGAYSAPRTPVEEILADTWSQVLHVKRVGIHDDFFELGGHSLLATQVVSRVREAFHVDLPLRSLFEAPTVAELARSVEAARCGAPADVGSITRGDGSDLPLSFAQQRLWFLDRLEPGSPLYNVAAAVRLTGSLDVTALERSLNEVVRRHEVLRATFPAIDGQAQLVVTPSLNVPLPVTDLQALPQPYREAEAQRLMRDEAQRSFDLGSGPLLRVHLIRLTPLDQLLLFSIHHIVFDGWSTSVFIRETAALYDAFTHDRPAPLPELPIQYADFAHWQRQWLHGAALQQQLAYWTQQLNGELPVLNLPTDRPRPALQTNHGAQVTFTLPADLALALNELCHQSGVTLFMTLLAAFDTLLQRYTGQDDICIGTPIANRTRAEIEDLIGCFVNTLVMRIRLDGVSGALTFRELLQHVREVTLNAYAHQDLPFEMIVDALHLSRDLSRTPLFQAMLVLQNAPVQALELPGLTVTEVPVEVGIANFDLTLTLQDQPSGLCGVFEYNTDLFDASTIERLAQQWQVLLSGIVANPDRPIAALPIMSEAEERRLLIEWNDTHADYSIEHCVHHLFEAQAARTPDALALVGDRQSLTYRELNRRANQLAHYLRDLKVGPETLVGLCADRSIELLIGLLGILKAGGAYVPLDPAYPAERLAFMLADSHAPIVVTQQTLTAQLLNPQSKIQNPKLVCLDADRALIEQCRDSNVESAVTPDNLAYVIYTSGSTGQPKGVMISHRALVNHNLAVQRAFELTPADRVLQFATINFDTAAEEIYPTWLSGATLVLRPNDLLTGAELLALIERERLTVLDLPTAYWHEWVYELSLAPQPLPPSLRLVIVGGEKVSAERYASWQKVGGAHVRWLNTYGPSEGTIIASIYEPPDQSLSGEVPIGRPLANDQLYILDRDLRPVPIGVPGELHIGGAGVARGYLNQPQLTSERFIPDPFSPSARRESQRGVLYKTGDLARYRPDGNIEFVGRVDQQVKVRGFRIELGEIEAALAQHSQVREAAVIAREDVPGDRRLVAYAVADQALDAGELRAFLKARLPDYMLPAAYVTLDALPLTPNHKVDRRALPAPDDAGLTRDHEAVEPHTSDEQTLAEIWRQVLGVKHVGVHDNFFELGGDSILSIQVIARANQAGLHLTPRQLFEHPTVAELAAVADRVAATSAEQGSVIGPVPFTPIQRWFFEQDWPNPHHWKQTLLLKVDQTLDSSLVNQAIERLVIQHDALRLRFEHTPAGWQQHIPPVVAAASDGAFTYVDLADVPDTGLGEAIETAAAWLRAVVNLRDGSLLRVAFFNCGAARSSRLLLFAHHLVIDTVSWRILLEDFQRVYQQLARGETVQLPLKTTSFKQWAERLTAYAQSPAAQRELDFWQSQARDAVARLPRDFTHGDNREASARTIKTALSVEDTHALLHEIPAVYQTEINDVLLTALAEALSSWIGSRALLIDQEGHGREALFDDVDLSRTVGWFTTVYPVRLDLRGVSGPGAALTAIKEQLRRVPHHGLGYGLLRYLSADRSIAGTLRQLPQPEISCNYLGQFDQALDTSFALAPAPEPTGHEHSPSDQRTHLLEVTGSVVGGQLQLEWIYSANLHRAETIDRVAHDFLDALRALIQHCQSSEAGGYTPSDFPDVELTEEDLAALLAETGA
jgi:amino acid adenylation domain-containing protein/non-ribosomal peptide synthase protein (TIGR01720 family)